VTTDLTRSIAPITGATSGIGNATAVPLAQPGTAVVVGGRLAS
jgi:NADP-dependent 3-hydroxy acid dehydrogenase YdfG